MVDFTLTDEQKDIRELAHDFAEKEIRPGRLGATTRTAPCPKDIIEKAWEVGLMNTHIPEEYGGPGLDYLSGCLIEEELGWGCSGIGTSLMCNGLATAPVAHRRLRGDQEGVPRDAHRGAQAGLLLPDRAGRRLRRVGHAHHRREEGRQVRHQRLQVLHHQRLATPTGTRSTRRPTRRPATAASRAFVVPRDAGVRGGQEGGQARPARLRHRDDLVQRRRDPRRQPARRGEQGLQARDDDARPHPAGRGGDGRRHRARRRSSSPATTPRSACSSACRSRCTRRSSS